MTQKQRSPRKAGHGHKLAGWVHRNSTLLQWLPVGASLVFAAAMAAHVFFGGAR